MISRDTPLEDCGWASPHPPHLWLKPEYRLHGNGHYGVDLRGCQGSGETP